LLFIENDKNLANQRNVSITFFNSNNFAENIQSQWEKHRWKNPFLCNR